MVDTCFFCIAQCSNTLLKQNNQVIQLFPQNLIYAIVNKKSTQKSKLNKFHVFPHFCRNFAFSDIRRQSRKSPATPPQLILHTSRIFHKSPATPPQLKMVEHGENRPNSAQKGQVGANSVFFDIFVQILQFPTIFVQQLHCFAFSPFLTKIAENSR